MYEFDTPRPIRLIAQVAAGDITVTAADVARTTVAVAPFDPADAKAAEQAGRVVVERSGDRVSVIDPTTSSWFRWPARLRVTVTVPAGSSVEASRNGADLHCAGPIHDLRVQSDDGDLSAELITGAAEVDAAGGSVRLDRVLGRAYCSAPTGNVLIGHAADAATVICDSGDVRIDAADGPLTVRCASGDVEVGTTRADVRVTAASGDVDIQRAYGGTVWAHADSGDITVGVPAGIVAHLDIRGDNQDPECDLAVTDAPADGRAPLSLRLHADCGRVRVHRASTAKTLV
jgi:hypothetical protein